MTEPVEVYRPDPRYTVQIGEEYAPLTTNDGGTMSYGPNRIAWSDDSHYWMLDAACEQADLLANRHTHVRVMDTRPKKTPTGAPVD